MPLAPGNRQFLADFDEPSVVLNNTAIIRRPDAVSFDYLTAFSVGPIAIGDVSQGILARVWRVRDDGAGNIMIARANDTNDGWDAESLLFTYDFDIWPIVELDFAFEQAGRAVVVAERPSNIPDGLPEIWLYWYNPAQQDFVFQNLGAGRTPRCVLDNPPDTTDSDVLIFYLVQEGGPT